MANKTSLPDTPVKAPQAEIDAVLEQMFGYFSRDLSLKTPKAAPVKH